MLPFQTIVCALDFEEGSTRALVRAADLAERVRADLHLLHVDPLFRARLAVPEGHAEEVFRRRVVQFVNETLGAGDAFDVLAPTVHQSYGEAPTDGILRYARHVGADLVVVGTHGRRGLGHLLVGSVAAETLRRSAVPVLVVPERAGSPAPGPARPVLAAVDFSGHARPALRLARDLADAYVAPVELVHVLDGPPEETAELVDLPAASDPQASAGDAVRDRVHHALQRLAEEGGGAVAARHVVPGTAGTGVVQTADARSAGTVVLGTHGRRGWDRVRLGSVAEWVVRHAACPVLVLPPAAGEEAASVQAADRARAS